MEGTILQTNLKDEKIELKVPGHEIFGDASRIRDRTPLYELLVS